MDGEEHYREHILALFPSLPHLSTLSPRVAPLSLSSPRYGEWGGDVWTDEGKKKRGKFRFWKRGSPLFLSLPAARANGLVQCADFCRKLPESVCVFECVCRGKWRDTPSGFFLTRVHHLLELLGFLCIVYDCVCVCLSDRDLDLAPWKRQHFSTLFHYGRNTHSRLIIHAGYRHLSHSFRWRDTTNDKKQGWKGVWEGRDAAVPLTKTADTSDPREKKKRGPFVWPDLKASFFPGPLHISPFCLK